MLETLSDADKDALIVRLWRDLQDERTRSQELERSLALHNGDPAQDGAAQDGTGASPLLEKLRQEKLREAGAGALGHRRIGASPLLGLGRGFLRARVLLAGCAIVALVFALDFAVGRYQQYRADHKRLADLKLQHAAYEGMFLEVVNVAYEPDQKSYRLTMKITNVEPGRPLYVMQSPVRVFEQSGLAWKEVPSGTRMGGLRGSSNSRMLIPLRPSLNPI